MLFKLSREFIRRSGVILVLFLIASENLAATVCLDEAGLLVYEDAAITGDGQLVWVGGYSNSVWMWNQDLSCTPGRCASNTQYFGGNVIFRLEGPGIDGYYSPEGGVGEFNSGMIPLACNATITNIEAETGVLLGGTQIYSDDKASSGQAVAYLSQPDAVLGLAGVPASTAIKVRYASALSGHISLRVDGVERGNIDFTATGGWLNSYGEVMKTLTINEGAVVELYFEVGDTAMNVDRVTFVTTDEVPQSNPYQVRIVYHIPAEKTEREDYKTLMAESLQTSQQWLMEQLGQTFTLMNGGEPTIAKSARTEASFQNSDIWGEIHADVIDIIGPGNNLESRIVFSSVDGVKQADGSCIGAGAAGSRIAIMSSDDLRGLSLEGTICDHVGEFDRGRWHGGQLHELLHTFTLPHPRDGEGNATPGYEGECTDNQCIMQFGWITFPETYVTPTDIYTLTRSPFLGREFGQQYTLENVNSGKCADIRFVSTIMATPVIQFFCFPESQNFKWIATQVGDFFEIENGQSLSCMNVPAASTVEGESIEIYRCDGQDSSLWDKQEQADGTVKFQNKVSGLCLGIQGDSLGDLADTAQLNCASPSTSWRMTPANP